MSVQVARIELDARGRVIGDVDLLVPIVHQVGGHCLFFKPNPNYFPQGILRYICQIQDIGNRRLISEEESHNEPNSCWDKEDRYKRTSTVYSNFKLDFSFIRYNYEKNSCGQAKEGIVLKPYNERERAFYERILDMECLFEFIPLYYGTLAIQPNKDDDIYIKNHPCNTKKKSLMTNGDRDIIIEEECPELKYFTSMDVNSTVFFVPNYCKSYKDKYCCMEHPWFLEMYNRMQNAFEYPRKYIVLEDLVDDLAFPCIMDLKIGKRHYCVDASDYKRQRQLHKSMTTTSNELCIRLCGVQIYKPSIKKYIFISKYEGRRLNGSQLKSTLRNFFVNGYGIHKNILMGFVNKLLRLKSLMLDELRYFRFYASSLLFLYDGCISGDYEDLENRSDIRLIDFANCYYEPSPDHLSESNKECMDIPDHSYIEGLDNLIAILRDILKSGLNFS